MIQDSTPLFVECLFVGNTSGAGGGGVCAIDESAPTFIDCEFRDNEGASGGAAMLEGGTAEFVGCLVVENTSYARGGGICASEGSVLTISHCTVAYNGATAAGGAIAVLDSHTDITNTIIAFGLFGGAVACVYDGTVAIRCSDVHGNMGGDWQGCLYGLEGVDGNFSADPLFCGEGPLLGPYTLDSDSPCAIENNAECGQVGALPVRCGAAHTGEIVARPPATIRLQPTNANPFCDETRLRYAIPSADPAAALRIAVHAADGRRVRVLYEGLAGTGAGEIAWDGRDAHGRQCPAGVYYVCLRSADQRAARPVVLTR